MEDGQITTMAGLDGVLSGIDPAVGATEDPPPAAVEQPAQQQIQQPQAQQPQAQAQTQPQVPNVMNVVTQAQQRQQQQQAQAAHAYAQLRNENSAYKNAMAALLEKAGLNAAEYSSPQQLLEMLQTAEIEEQAEEYKIPPEILHKMNRMEQFLQEQQRVQLHETANAGFQTVQQKYGLNDAQLIAFANQLQADGINPYETMVDLDREFVYRNFDALLAQERSKFTQAAAQQQTHSYAQKHSTTPSRVVGTNSSFLGGDKINTMAQLNKLLSQLK